jgi:hypothetical protein
MTGLLAGEGARKVDVDKVEIRLEAPADDRGGDDKAAADLQKALGGSAPPAAAPKDGPAPAKGAAPKSEEEKAAEEIERQLRSLK